MVTHSGQRGVVIRGYIQRGSADLSGVVKWVSPTCPGLPAPTRPFPLFAFVFLIALGIDDNIS